MARWTATRFTCSSSSMTSARFCSSTAVSTGSRNTRSTANRTRCLSALTTSRGSWTEPPPAPHHSHHRLLAQEKSGMAWSPHVLQLGSLRFCPDGAKAPYVGSKWWPVMRTDWVLFGAEGEHGIDGGSFARGQVASKESNGEKQKARGYDGGQVVSRKSEEHAGDKPSRGKARRNADRNAEQSQREGFAQNHPTNASRLCAQRDANADFARAARDAIRHQSIQPNGGQQQCQTGEKAAQHGVHAFEHQQLARYL